MTSYDVNATDAVTVTGAVQENISAQCVVTETVTVSSLLEVIKEIFDVLSETVNVTSPAEAGLSFQATASDSVTVTDTASLTKLVLVTVEETVTVTDTVIPNASLQALCEEGVVVSAFLVIDGETYVVWVANAETMAHSTYTNFNFNSMCRLGNSYYGANDEGIFLLEGEEDVDEPIQFFFTLPTTDFDDSGLKRVPEALMGFKNNGDMVIQVVTDPDTPPSVYHFERTSRSNQQARAKIGQGIKARYWTFDFYNTDGEDAEIDTVEFSPIFLRRLR